uniref:Uncharacterized protein n=1 Tax=viral metagenome TaxID=1070528 RepID=A0A2V0RAT8_9ZZZZ
MSQTPEQYKGKLPRPSKTQSIQEFEDEEIKPDPEYTEFNSVAEILARPEYFKLIIEQPEFLSMLKREGMPNPLDKQPDTMEKKEEQKQPDEKEKESKKVEEPEEAKASTDEEEPKASIDVVMVPSLEEVAPMPEDAMDMEPKAASLFEPKYRRVKHELTQPVEIDVTHGLATLRKSGLDDLMVKYSGDRRTKKGSKMFKWLQGFRPMGIVNPVKFDDVTGMVSSTNHSFVFGEDVSGKSASAHKYELNRLRPKVVQSTRGAVDSLLQDYSLPDVITSADEGANEVFDLSVEPRPNDVMLKSADVILNPWRLPLIVRDTKAFRHMTLTFDTWRREHAPFINDMMLRYIRLRNAKDRDVVTTTTLARSMYDRFVLRGMGGNNSNDYYYTDIPNDRHFQLCESVLNRSLARAMEAMSTLTSSQRSITTNITNRQASHMLLGLTSVQPSEAVNFARHLGGFLLGGQRRKLEVDIDEGTTKTPLINALCSFATLILVDKRFVDDRSYRQLLVNVLLPFYDEFSIQRKNSVTNRLETSEDVHSIADKITRGDINLPKVTKMVDPSGRGGIKSREIRVILTNLLTRIAASGYVQTELASKMFKTPAAAPFLPFTARSDIVDIVLFGTRTDGDESRMHELSSYKPEALRASGLLEEFSELLSKLRQFDGIGLAMSEAMRAKTHVSKSMAIFNDAFIRGSMHTELLPASGRTDESRAIDTVTLPFDGALSFLLYGIGSSEVADSSDAYVRFKALSMTAMPSLYPVYLYIERAITQSAFIEFGGDENLIITNRDLVIDACLDALSVYFDSVDPDSRDRISYLFDERTMLEGGAGFELPTLLTSTLHSLHDYQPIVGKDGQRSLPGSFDTNADIAEKNVSINAYEEAVNVVDKVITEMYIDFDPLVPTKIETYNSGSTLVYTGTPVKAEYLDLKDIISNAQYIDSDNLSLDVIKNLARSYLRRNADQFRNATFKGVVINKIRTSFKFVEHTGLSDITVAAPTITIDRSSKYLDADFDVGEISVYYHRLTDRQGSLSDAVIASELEYLNGFMTYVSVHQDMIQKHLINFDHSNPMNPSVYKLSNGARVPDDAITDVKIRDGSGVTYAGRVTLSTRESEEITIVDNLNSREVFGGMAL